MNVCLRMSRHIMGIGETRYRGISSGATCAAARVHGELCRGVVVFFASSAERYLSTPLYRGLLDEE